MKLLIITLLAVMPFICSKVLFGAEVIHDQEVCFSPFGRCDEKLTAYILSATRSIDVAIYDLTLKAVAMALSVQSKKIPVRIIVDHNQSKNKSSLVSSLIRDGISVRYGKQSGIFHNKFTVVDSKLLETGSFDYTGRASERNNENQVYLTSPIVVEQYVKHFEELWKQGLPAKP